MFHTACVDGTSRFNFPRRSNFLIRPVCFDCFDKIGVWFVIRHKYLEESLLISLRHCLFVLLGVSLFESCELDKAGGSETRVGSGLLRLILVFWVESWFCSFCFGL